MRIEGKVVPPPVEFWVPDYSDFALPLKPGGGPYEDPEDYEAYLNWLVVHMENNEFPLNAHQQEIISDPVIQDWDAERLGLRLGGASMSLYYQYVEPPFEYPDDFLLDPTPERVCNPGTTDWLNEFFHEEYDYFCTK